jgi:hypothetical protein
MAAVEWVSVLEDGSGLQARWSDGAALRFHAIWLRDNALDPDLSRAALHGPPVTGAGILPGDFRGRP